MSADAFRARVLEQQTESQAAALEEAGKQVRADTIARIHAIPSFGACI